MASLSGIRKALMDLMPMEVGVTVTDGDMRIASRALQLIKNLLANREDDDEDQTLAEVEEIDDLDYDEDSNLQAADVSAPKKYKFNDWSDEKKDKLVKAYDDAPYDKKMKAVKFLLSVNQRDQICYADIERFRVNSLRTKTMWIRDHVMNKFKDARAKRQMVTTLDMRYWALEMARDIGMRNFLASKSWLYTLKSHFKWSSRKVTKLVTFKEVSSRDDLSEKMLDMILRTRDVISNDGISHSRIINIDQSGFNYDYAPKRTLSMTGERHTEVAVKSKDQTTHSYSIQVAISAAGSIVGPVHLMLQEPGKNEFGPRVKPQVDAVIASLPADQIMVNCSSSGKFGSASYASYIDRMMEVLGSEFPVLLLKDSWTGQTGARADAEVFEKYENLRHETFPPGSTAFLQPEDLVLFHPWKMFWREAIKHIRFMDIDVSLSDRLNIIVIHALIRNQLSSIVFREMLIYGFSKPGIIDDDQEGPGFFQSAKDVWFQEHLHITSCSRNRIQSPCKKVFICCSHCGLPLCFIHFFGTSDGLFTRHFHV